jgi:hypothetical protein
MIALRTLRLYKILSLKILAYFAVKPTRDSDQAFSF